MSNLDLETHSINVKCPKCSRIVSETIKHLKNNPVTYCNTCNDSFDVQEEDINKGIDRISATIASLKESLKKGW
ncbi:hypothetical protein [Wohlfahrtiimonas larvae]|uniref:Uncharacterized protein n=1 Tax=Wohlfahrtiimonas larvae TaxID=1157986 RepID=A0ABP9MS66_9GAMM|nr:hypothetical protein [Wohlfahrtiimonas larvae]